MQTSPIKLVLLSTSALLALTSPAYAYLDPGTGSIILQAIVGGIAAVSVGFAAARHQLKAFFSKLFGKNSNPEDHKENE